MFAGQHNRNGNLVRLVHDHRNWDSYQITCKAFDFQNVFILVLPTFYTDGNKYFCFAHRCCGPN